MARDYRARQWARFRNVLDSDPQTRVLGVVRRCPQCPAQCPREWVLWDYSGLCSACNGQGVLLHGAIISIERHVWSPSLSDRIWSREPWIQAVIPCFVANVYLVAYLKLGMSPVSVNVTRH